MITTRDLKNDVRNDHADYSQVDFKHNSKHDANHEFRSAFKHDLNNGLKMN